MHLPSFIAVPHEKKLKTNFKIKFNKKLNKQFKIRSSKLQTFTNLKIGEKSFEM